ncbi:hypothetical protein [Fictibacillus enclensis]|uniref:hypothetical protein n=1 Tax=Fictibacillus enclensis TaxID=1017270 RepID=UPI0012E3C456|nr:hypothetical protein [Fictibacillus enclensis]
MQRDAILSVEIKGLFGYKSLKIHLDQEVKIFIGENGTGKTSISTSFPFCSS